MSAVRTDWGHATEFNDIRGQVAICGVGESDHSKASGRSAEDIAAEAIARAIEDAGLEPADIDGIMFPGGMAEAFDASAFRRRFGGDGEMFESGRGGAMVWAATAPAVAARALADGRARYIVNAFSVAWASQRGQMTGGPGQFHAGDPFKSNLEAPFGWFPQPVYFATIARRHMHEFGTTEEQLGSIAVTCRRHANLTPSAVMHDKTLTLEDYLARPMLADPLRVEDCCLISDGGAAYIMTTPERAGDLRQKAVTVEGIGEGVSGSGLYWAQQPAFTSTPQVFAAPAAYRMAGIGPDDVDVLALYDPFTIVALMQIEDMGFCDKGDGGVFAVSGALDFDSGRLPYNTHGGLLSHAYVLGNAHVVELVRQLRGQAEAQAGGPELAVYGGYTGHLAATMVLRGA